MSSLNKRDPQDTLLYRGPVQRGANFMPEEQELIRDENGRFVPGVSGNPGGRPKKDESLTAALREKVDKQTIADKLIELAMDGDIVALKYVYDRIDGRPIETVNQTVRELPNLVRFDDTDDSEDTGADTE